MNQFAQFLHQLSWMLGIGKNDACLHPNVESHLCGIVANRRSAPKLNWRTSTAQLPRPIAWPVISSSRSWRPSRSRSLQGGDQPMPMPWPQRGASPDPLQLVQCTRQGMVARILSQRRHCRIHRTRSRDPARLGRPSRTGCQRFRRVITRNHPAHDLSPRQREVLDLLLTGKNGKQIAADLRLSVHTVNDYIKAIYRRYDVSSRAELLAAVHVGA